jgi:HAD superfamily hydrolase (TIGR01459 family)
MTHARFVGGLAALVDRYDGFVLDQWGVLHDGLRPYPGAVDVLEALHSRSRPVVLLSNSGRRAALSRERLRQIGFDPTLFTGVVTSGETAWQGFRERIAAPFDRLGRRCVLLTREGDLTVAEGLDLELVDAPEEAEFLFLSGVEPPPMTAEDYEPILERCLACRLPMLCTNPDLVAVTGDELTLAPGTLGQRYEGAGGTVHYVGKPHPPVYAACRALLPGTRPDRILAVGDSLAHDIRGANRAGFAAAFVTDGIHREAFPPDLDEPARTVALERLEHEHDAHADWVIPRLVW